MEDLWNIDLGYGSTSTDAAAESPENSTFSANTSEGSFSLPGDEPPPHNNTFSSYHNPSNRRWFLPPSNLNSSDLTTDSSSFPVN